MLLVPNLLFTYSMLPEYIRNIEIGASNLSFNQLIHHISLLLIDMENNLLESNTWVDEYASSSDQASQYLPASLSSLSHNAQQQEDEENDDDSKKQEQDYQRIWEKRKQGQNQHKRIDTELSASSAAAISSNSFISRDQVITTMKIKLTEAEYQRLMARKKLYNASNSTATTKADEDDGNHAKGSHR